MKQVSLVLNVILFILIGILYYVHFFPNKTKSTEVPIKHIENGSNNFKIAYFEMDSLESQYGYIKEIRNELKNKQIDMNAELGKLRKNYQARMAQLQEKASTMSQAEGEAAQREAYQMQQNLAEKEQNLNQIFQQDSYQKMQNINKQIEDFLKEYNKTKGYSYIITHQPGFIYYRNPSYNITQDLINGLNAQYTPKEKK